MTDHTVRKDAIESDEPRGFTRRDVLRRGAVVGGTLAWAAPAVQTLARPAFAAHGTNELTVTFENLACLVGGGQRAAWKSRVRIIVTNDDGMPVADATINGSFTVGTGQHTTCTTDSNGQCYVTATQQGATDGTTFNLDSASHPDFDAFHADPENGFHVPRPPENAPPCPE